MYKLADKFFIYSILTLYFSCFLFSKFFIISFHEILCIWYFCESFRLLSVVIRLMVHAILITPYRVFNSSASCNRRQFFFILKDLITLYYSITTIYLTYGFYYLIYFDLQWKIYNCCSNRKNPTPALFSITKLLVDYNFSVFCKRVK